MNTDLDQRHKGSAVASADKPYGGGAPTPRLKNSPKSLDAPGFGNMPNDNAPPIPRPSLSEGSGYEQPLERAEAANVENPHDDGRMRSVLPDPGASEVTELRSQLADAELAYAKADRALEAAIRARVRHPGFDASMADPSVRAALDAYDAPEALMAELAAQIEAMK